MATLQETHDLQAAEQFRAQISEDRRLIQGFEGNLVNVREKLAACQELIELTKDRPNDVGDNRRATEKFAKISRQAAELEQRIANAKHRIETAQQRIGALDHGQAGDPVRTAKIRNLFQRIAG